MTFKIADRVKETSDTVGSGDINFTGSVNSSFQRFDSVLGSGDTTFYVAEDGDSWEVGVGTYISNSLQRTSILSSSNNNNTVSLNGRNIVSLTYPSERAVYLNESLDTVAGSGITFLNDSAVLNTSGGFLYWDNNQLAYETDNIYVSGIAVFASGQSVVNQQSIAENDIDIAYISGIATFASGNSLAYKKYQNSSGDVFMDIQDDIVFVDSTPYLINVYIPIASGNGGKEITIKRVAGDNDVIIVASGTEMIDGQSTYAMRHLYQSSTLISNNFNWYIT